MTKTLFLVLILLGLGTNVRGEDGYAVSGTTVWQETFANIVNTGGNPKSLTERFDEVMTATGWSGERVSAPAHSTNEVQIGTGKAHGRLVTPGLAAGERLSFVMTARRHTADGEGRTCPVFLLTGTTTGATWSVTLKDEYRDYALMLPTLTGGERICVHSMTNNLQGRVLVRTVRLVRDAILPSDEEEDSDAGETALSGQGFVSLKAHATGRGYRWREDFTAWTNVTKKTDLKDGRYGNWWFEKDDLPAPAIGRTGGSSTSAMVYVGYTNALPASASLATLTSADSGFRYGLSFTNDTGRILEGFSLGFDPVQWKMTKQAKTLTFAYAVTTDPGASPVWLPAPALDWTAEVSSDGTSVAGYRRGTRRMAILEAVVPPGGVVHACWTDAACATAPILGLDDVELVCTPRRQCCVIRIR